MRTYLCIACLEPVKDTERYALHLAPGKSLWLKQPQATGIWCFWCADLNTSKRNARIALKLRGKR